MASVTVDQIRQALSEAGLLGSSLIPSNFNPSVTVHATYPKFGNIQPGETYAIDQTQDEPTVSFNAPAGKEAKYTIVFADPDAPSREDQKWSPFRHMVLADVVPGQHPGQTLTGYMGPAPPEGTGPHRYVFLVYSQPVDRTPVLGVDGDDKRPSYDVQKFARDNELELIGANFFYAENKK